MVLALHLVQHSLLAKNCSPCGSDSSQQDRQHVLAAVPNAVLCWQQRTVTEMRPEHASPIMHKYSTTVL